MLIARRAAEFKSERELGIALGLYDAQDIRANLDYIANCQARFALRPAIDRDARKCASADVHMFRLIIERRVLQPNSFVTQMQRLIRGATDRDGRRID